MLNSVNDAPRDFGHQIGLHMVIECKSLIPNPKAVKNDKYVGLVMDDPESWGNFALVIDPNDELGTEAAIEHLSSCLFGTEILFPGDVSREVDRVLSNAGYECIVNLPRMAIDLCKIAEPSQPAGLEFKIISTQKQRLDWIAAMAANYGIHSETAAEFFPPDPGEGVIHFGVFRESAIVATSMLLLADGLAGIYCVSTDPLERRKGLGAYVTSQTFLVAQQHNYRVGILHASTLGSSVYRRLGFQEFGSLPVYAREQSDTPDTDLLPLTFE